ncbi:MAG: N-acetylmuramoyl-L-alanine amidase [Clostridia bacterium]|nr:N-acetylmuramoyl-L-alanine amidase [Clostridia bacterium]
MTGTKKRTALGFMFRFLVFLAMFFAAYVIFVLLGDVLGVVTIFPDPSQEASICAAPKSQVYIIDPGHGGIDGGAIGVNGVYEKDVNLAIAMKIGRFLELSGAKVIYTRDSDVLLTHPRASTSKSGDVMARVKIARENPDAVFVSVHANKYPQSSCRGLQVFYTTNSPSSIVIADAVQNGVRLWLQPDNDRHCADCGSSVYVLDRIDNTAILIECGFLSNREEAMLLVSEEYQNSLAFVIAHSIAGFSEAG